jgi:hypothetical protein
MPRYRRPPLTVVELQMEGPAVRLRDIEALSGLGRRTVLADVEAGILRASRRVNRPNSVYFVARQEARRYLGQIGCL